MSSWLLHPDPINGDGLPKVKQAVLMEYTPVSEWSEDSSLAVLIQHKDSFEWMDISHAIPIDSEREYPPPSESAKVVRKIGPQPT